MPPGAASDILLEDRRLPPVVDDEGIARAVPSLVGTVHRHALEVTAEASAGQHPPCSVAARVRAGHEDRRAALGGQAVTRVDQPAEDAFRIGTRPDGAELDVARA